MKLGEFGVGKITKQNATKDAPIGSEYSNVKKLGLGSGKPKLHNKKATKNSDPNTLFNLGIGESKELKVQKRTNGFTVDMHVDGKHVGQYTHTREDDTVRNFAEVFPEYRNKGFGSMLLLAAIKTAEDLGLDFEEDSASLTPAMSRLYDTLDDEGLIYGGGGAWAISPSGETELEDFLDEGKMNELRIEKPDPKDTLGIERKFMPQIKSDDYEEFIEYLTNNGVKFKQETIPASELKAMQNQFSDKGILKQLEKNIAQGPNTKAVIASSDDYILDGHHRWLVAVNIGTDLNVYRVNMPAYKLYDLVNQFQKVYYKDIYDEGKPTIGVPLSSGLTVSIFPHRPLRIKKSTPGKLRYDEGVDITQTPIYEEWSAKYKKSINCSNPKGFSQKAHCASKKKNEDDSLGSQINFPGFEKKEKPKPKYNPVPKKDKSVLDKIKGFFTGENINEAYLLQLERGKDDLVLHVKDTKTGERMEVRGKPGYETSYDSNDKLHQLLDIIGKASNISELMNGAVVNVNPKHPDGPRSYSALDNLMNEAIEPQFDVEWDEAARYPEFVAIGKKAWIELASKGRAVTITDASDINNTDAADPDSFKNLDKNKQARALAQIEKGSVEMPIVAVYSDGYKELIGGNTRLTAMMAKDGRATVWQFEVPDEVATLAEAQVEEGVNDPHIFKAVFLAGGPGSGKSFVARNILGGTGLRSVNSDEVYEFLMKKQGLSLDPDTIFSPQGQEIRDKAKGISRKRERTYLDGRLGLIIDGTGKDVNKYETMAQKLRAIGYDTSMIYVNTSLDVAQQRNRQRERSLEPAKVEQMWNDVQQNLMKFQQIFGAGRFHIIDNSGGLEDLDRQKNFDKVYNETQRFLNTPPSKPKAKQWIQQQKEQNDEKRSATQRTNNQSNGGTPATN